ncbi:MAG: tRNA (adenine-N1)-methyltransferase [Thermoplasmata archaeon]
MISQGDWIMLWSPNSVELLLINGETKRVPGLGVIDTERFIGKSYGSKTNMGRESYYLLRPSLRHGPDFIKRGPQIIQPVMTSVMIHQCDIKCGDMVVEGGAGSGMLSAALLQAVGTEGRVYTYEIKREHLDIAEGNVKSLGFESSWIPRIGDVTRDVEEREVDALVVDIPQPWEALNTAVTVLKGGGVFLAYVPTTNQVERIYNTLKTHHFEDLESSEIFQRKMVVTDGGVRPSFQSLGHNGYVVRGTKTENTQARVDNPA